MSCLLGFFVFLLLVFWLFFFLCEWKLLSILVLVKIFPFDLRCHASSLQINNTNTQVFKTKNHTKSHAKKAAVNDLQSFLSSDGMFGGGQCKAMRVGLCLTMSKFKTPEVSHWLFEMGRLVYRVPEVRVSRRK